MLGLGVNHGLCVCLVIGCLVGVSTGLLYEKTPKIRLLDDLFKNYNTMIRPVYNDSTQISLALGMAVKQMISMDEVSQRLSLSVWLRMLWKDEFLQWNSSEYGGTSELTIPLHMVWLPDIKLYNNIDEEFLRIDETMVILYSDGTVYWLTPAIVKASCRVDLWKFPFDQQSCFFKFGSWSYNGYQMDIVNRSDSVDTGTFLENGEWEIVSAPAQRNVIYYGCCPWPYPDVTFTLVIKRMPLFYVFNLLMPNLLIAGLTLLGFWLPAESGEKITLTITNLLSLIVFHQLVAQTMPPTGDSVPIIAQYFASMIVMVCFSCVMNVWVLNIFHTETDTTDLPKWVRFLVFEILAPAVCMGQEKEQNKINQESTETGNATASPYCYTNVLLPLTEMSMNGNTRTISGMLENTSSISESATHRLNNESPRSQNEDTPKQDKQLHDICQHLEFLVARAKRKDKRKKIIHQWQEMAQVIDRILMWVFVLYVFVLSVVMYLRAQGRISW
ncbi:neuronal acetylcholine receptor subunit alpha-10-like [Saccoglossus kowalevskii]